MRLMAGCGRCVPETDLPLISICGFVQVMPAYHTRMCVLTAAIVLPALICGAQNVGLITLERNANYYQRASGELLPLAEPFTLRAVMQLASGPGDSFVHEVILQPPSGNPMPMAYSQANAGFMLYSPFDTASGLESAFGAGDYSFTLNGYISGETTYVLNVPSASLQPRPLIVNFAATQNIDPTKSFVLRWTPAVASPGNARLRIRDDSTFTVIYDSGSIPGGASDVEIPAGLLIGSPTSRYVAQLSLTRVDFLRTGDTPSLLVAASVATTSIELNTGTGTVDPAPSRFRSVSLNGSGDIVFTVECTPGVPLNLRKSATPTTGWETVRTVTPDVSPTVVTLPIATLGDAAFFQATQ